MAEFRIGTSSFTAKGWESAFYPAGMKAADYLSYYATKFSTVEIDSTYYRTPSPATVQGWARKTPEGFLFAAKVPQVITHEKMLLDCQPEFEQFVDTMDLLGDDKLGPFLIQFPYFNKTVFKSGAEFTARLEPFLEKLPKGYRFALELRNKSWLNEKFADLLRKHNVSLVLQDQSWMPQPDQMDFDYVTASFTYIRLLGDRKGIEQQTKVWDKVIVNRSKDLPRWVEVCQSAIRRKVNVYAYVNNHYSGFAPATVTDFLKLWTKAKG